MPPSDCSCGEEDLMVNKNFHHHGIAAAAEHDDDGCCYNGGNSSTSESLEDTLSLTCDDSMESTLSSSSDTSSSSSSADDSTDNSAVRRINVYQSPDILRRRLLPLPPSPIREKDYDTIHIMKPLEKKILIRKKPSIRFLWFLLSTLSFFMTMTTDLKWISSDYKGGGDSSRYYYSSQETRQWRDFFRHKAPKIVQKLSAHKSLSPEFTVRIRGQRLDLMLQSLDFHAQCPLVKTVQIDWRGGGGDPSQIPEAVLQHQSGNVQALTTGGGKVPTPGVFLLDEDVLLTCEEMERAFQEWRIDPSRLVGFYPFHHTTNTNKESPSETFIPPSLRIPSTSYQFRQVPRGDAYSMLSDKAVFVHNQYLRVLPVIPSEEKCQHLALSILVSTMTSKPPTAVMSNPHVVRQHNQAQDASSFKIQTQQCQQWIDVIGGAVLPDTVAMVVGH